MNAARRRHTPIRIGRRDFLRMAGWTSGAAFLAACNTATPAPPTAAPATEAPAEPEPVELAWWSPFEPHETGLLSFPAVVEEFEALYPWITVDFELTGGPPGGGDFTEVLLARIAAGNPPQTATVWAPPNQYAARGSLTAIDDMMAGAQWATPDAFFEGPLKTCQWRGKTYGLPASAGAGSIYFNLSKFEELGISTNRADFPATWDDLKALSAEFVIWDGDTLVQAGFVPWAESWLKPVWSGLNGGQLFDGQGEQYAVDSEQNIEWLDYWVRWLDEQYHGDVEQLNVFGNWSGVGANSGFGLGLSAMAQGGSWSTTVNRPDFEWEVARFPVGPSGSKSVTGFWPNWWVIPSGAANLEEAFLFCEYFCTKGWETRYRIVMDTPAWKGFSSEVLTQQLIDQVGNEKAQDLHNFYASYLNDTVEMWTSPVEDFASELLDSTISEVLHKTKTPAEALAEAQTALQARLEQVLA